MQKVVRKSKKNFIKKKVCGFCMEKAERIDYKDVGRFRKYVTEKGKIIPRRLSGNCAKQKLTIKVSKKANLNRIVLGLYANLEKLNFSYGISLASLSNGCTVYFCRYYAFYKTKNVFTGYA